MIEEFVQHLNRCRCPRYGRTHRRDLRKVHFYSSATPGSPI
jgi:hypothetical protein